MTSLFHCHFTAVYFEKWGSSSIPQRKTNVACAALTETGTKMKKEKLQERFDRHIQEKTLVREKKEEMKTRALADRSVRQRQLRICNKCCTCQYPKGASSSYKRRFASYNFTIYNLGSGAGHCYFWPESFGCQGNQ